MHALCQRVFPRKCAPQLVGGCRFLTSGCESGHGWVQDICDKKMQFPCAPARARQAAMAGQISAHHCSTLALMVSRTSRVRASFSSRAPGKPDGSGKLQCKRVVTPGKMGQRSALASSQTVMTWAKLLP